MLDLHSETESDFIKGRCWGGAGWAFVGAGEEDWKWLSNAKVNYTRWFYPSSGSSTDRCVMMEKSGDWGSVPCGSDTLAFVICDFVPGYNPFVLVGPVVILSGVAVLILSIEVCIRRKEFKEKNLEAPVRVTTAKESYCVLASVSSECTKEVDAGLINYGYGNFEGDDINQTVNWPPVDASSPAKSTTPSYTGLQHEQQPMVSPRVENEGGSGPMVHVVPASPSLVAPTPENTRSQEQLELLLSPKTLE
ncbi:putative Lectin C-type domain-containing protein 8 [Homarus americanus]|uniref:Putative Lectin C-type domain-containing protein 8 n=1 Tax=Homarus americanus TaxID=6706 RepID=A0A8J5JZ45_HOMAM|nr:putative Lectin C-type domain-containing protein 8 [Homarus americanus]